MLFTKERLIERVGVGIKAGEGSWPCSTRPLPLLELEGQRMKERASERRLALRGPMQTYCGDPLGESRFIF